MKFLHFALFLTAYTTALLFGGFALLGDSLPFVACTLLSLVLGEIFHRKMQAYD